MIDEHVKAAAQDVAEDATQDVAKGILGAAEDGSVKVFIVARALFQRRNPRPTSALTPTLALGRHVKDGHVKGMVQDAAEDVAEDVPQDVTQDLAFGARAARALFVTPLPPPPSLRSSR